MFIAVSDGQQYLFDGSFDDAIDDYPGEYSVYLLPRLSADELAGSWANLVKRAVRRLGVVPTGEICFDPTKRHHIDGDVLRRFPADHPRGKAV
jgi:hypothetical protein